MSQQKLAFIGGGNMATSLIGGLIANGYQASSITACDIDEDKLAGLSRQFGISTTTDSGIAVEGTDIVILAVKPQIMQTACEKLAESCDSSFLFISIAAGIEEEAIDRWLGGNHAIVRCMPNTPALMQLGVTGLYANTRVSAVTVRNVIEVLQPA